MVRRTERADMYPLSEGQIYPKNQWYVAGFAEEFGRTLVERTILNEPVVFYRTLAGEPVALAGLCPHRLYPLAQSTLDGDTIRCGYHGFTFDRAGACTHIPSQDRPPERFRTRVYPLVEKGPLVWIWPGDPMQADSSLVPDTQSIGIDAQGWRADANGRIDLKARYMLLVDNLLDLTHIGFTHATSLPSFDFLIPEAPVIEDKPDLFRVGRKCTNHPLAPLHNFIFPDYQGRLDSEATTEFFSCALINAGGLNWTPAAEGERKTVGTTNFIHILTPETPTTTHYFSMLSRNYRLEDDAFSAALKALDTRVRLEDKAALELIEKRVDAQGDLSRELSGLADGGALRVRRRIAAQIAAEQSSSIAAQ